MRYIAISAREGCEEELARIGEMCDRERQSIFLSLWNLELSSLPSSLNSVPRVVSLNAAQNNLTLIPKQLKNLSKLQKLLLDDNSIENVPSFTFTLPLRELHLNSNKISSIDAIPFFSHNLSTLCLKDNRLTEIPNSLSSIKSLTSLDLSHNSIEMLPEDFNAFSSLHFLYLHHNNLILFVPRMRGLVTLRELYLSHNSLADLPELDTCYYLEILTLSHNELTSIRTDFRKLRRLIVLTLTKNPLERPPLPLSRMLLAS